MGTSAHSTLLIVDDDVAFVRAAAEIAGSAGYDVSIAGCVEHARTRLRRQSFDLVLLDLSLPDGSGMDLVEDCDLGQTQVVIVTGHPTVETLIRAFRAPLFDYLIKPIQPVEYRELLERTAQTRALPIPSSQGGWCGLVGESAELAQVITQIKRVAATDAAVLIQGESGVGKELVAHAIHANSGRGGEFVALNCGAVAPELLASQLFGHERGSFTGATARHIGYFEQAHGGTLFLDEITEMPLHLQVHLLRALENRTVRRVGGNEDIAVDARIVAATNFPLGRAIGENRLREDLFYRLGEFPLTVPPLRDRADDVVPLANLFLARLNDRYGEHKAFTPAALAQLKRYPWPGNVRELRNLVGRAYLMAGENTISRPLEDVKVNEPLDETASSLTLAVGMSLEEIERRMLIKTLAHFNDDKTKAARVLGVSVKTIYNKLARYHELDSVSGDAMRSA